MKPSANPFPHRFLAFLLLAIEVATLSVMSGRVGGAWLALALGAIGVYWKRESRMSLQTQLIVCLVLAIFYGLRASLFPIADIDQPSYRIPYAKGYSIAQYFLMLQALTFFVTHGGRLAPIAPLFGAVVMSLAGNRHSAPELIFLYRVLSVIFGVVTVLFCFAYGSKPAQQRRAGRVRSVVVSAAILCFAVALAWTGSAGFAATHRYLENWFIRVQNSMRDRTAGFSPFASLGSRGEERGGDNSAVALRVFSSGEPGYLRGKALTLYRNSSWSAVGDPIPRSPAFDVDEGRPELRLGESLFRLAQSGAPGLATVERNSRPEEWTVLRILTSTSCGNTVFTRTDSPYAALATDQVFVSPAQSVEAKDRRSASAHRLFVRQSTRTLAPPAAPPKDPMVPSSRSADSLLGLPENLDPRIPALAARVFGGCDTAADKIEAVEHYFRSFYRYHVGIEIPLGQDPLTYFLTERPPAHCEYFASGAAVLLRLGGVPCRYVTGFVVREKNDVGGYWIARNRDAHAWVEAYDAARGWVVVEATPDDGIPHPVSASTTSQLWDFAKSRLQIIAAFFKKDWPTILGAAADFVTIALTDLARTSTGRATLLVIAAVVGLFFYRRRRKARAARPDPLSDAAQRMLAEFERRLAPLGLVRPVHETLHHFADRISAHARASTLPPHAADWLRDFATVRYAVGWTAEDLRQFRCRLRSLAWRRD